MLTRFDRAMFHTFIFHKNRVVLEVVLKQLSQKISIFSFAKISRLTFFYCFKAAHRNIWYTITQLTFRKTAHYTKQTSISSAPSTFEFERCLPVQFIYNIKVMGFLSGKAKVVVQYLTWWCL